MLLKTVGYGINEDLASSETQLIPFHLSLTRKMKKKYLYNQKEGDCAKNSNLQKADGENDKTHQSIGLADGKLSLLREFAHTLEESFTIIMEISQKNRGCTRFEGGRSR